MITHAEALARKTQCQHCYADIVPTAAESRWMAVEGDLNVAVSVVCEYPSHVLHKPMPKIGADR